MEWVETTGRTIDEAKELALDQLGVHEEDAEFDVVEEPRPGLFGRIRGEARVRARVRPTQPRPKTERRDRKRKSTGRDDAPADDDAPTTDAPAAEPVEAAAFALADDAPPPKPRARANARPAAAESNGPKPSTARVTEPTDDAADDQAGRDAERQAASTFLQGLALALGENDATTEIVVLGDDEAEVRLDGGDLGLLIGPRGQTLIAVQDLTRLAAQRHGADRRGRLRIDIAGYRERRRVALARFTEQVADEVRASGTARALEPMSSMDRKVVHDAANELDGVETISEGEEPFRRVVIRPTVSA
jgi:spoIIIJ-associated protein